MAINESQMIEKDNDPLITNTTTVFGGAQEASVSTARPVENNGKVRDIYSTPRTSIFDNELRMSTRTCYVSEGAKRLIAAIEEEGKKGIGIGRKFELIQLPTYGYLVTFNQASVILLFEENIPTYSGDFMPKARYFNIARGEVAKMRPSANIVMPYLVTADTYNTDADITVTVNEIMKTLMLGISSELDLSNLANTQFRILNDGHAAASYIATVNPSKVAPYMQYGTCFQAQVSARDGSSSSWGNNNNSNDTQWTNVFALGAYTSFDVTGARTQVLINGKQESVPVYRPLIRISAVASAINAVRLLPLITTIGYDSFLSQQQWKKPFRLTENGTCSLGKLYTDASGMPLEIKNQTDLDALFSTMANPVLMFESCEGAFEYIGANAMSAALVNKDAHAYIKKECAAFLNAKNTDVNTTIDPSSIQDVVYLGMQEHEPIRYTGSVIVDGNEVDSRAIDYFQAVSVTGSPRASENFLFNSIGGCDAHLHDIADIGYTQQNPRYFCRCFILNPAFIHQMVEEIVKNLRISSNNVAHRGSFFSNTILQDVGNNYQGNYTTFGNGRQPIYRTAMQYSGWGNLR